MIKQEKNILKTVYVVRKRIFPLFVLVAFFVAGYFYLNYWRQSNVSIGFTKINSAAGDEQDFSPDNLQVSGSEIRFSGKLLETSRSLPYIFLEEYLKLDDNAKYTHSIFDDQRSGNQFLRVDKLVFDAGSYSSRVTAFYLFSPKNGEYKRVLQSSKEQNEARYPETEIISQDPLMVRFYYDVSRPLGCYGDGCRSYWADHFRWDSGQEKFVEINGEFIDFYKDLLKKYETMNTFGCDFGNAAGGQLKSLEEVYNSSEINYCIDTTELKLNKRADLNNFFEYKKRVAELAETKKTVEIEYQQTYVPKESMAGDCWTSSIAAQTNRKAWRCSTISNFIYDPCFEAVTGEVVCGVDPEKADSGFTLNLTKELPEWKNSQGEYKQPWWVKLDDGSICLPMTGTAGSINGEFYYYSCDMNDTVLVGSFDNGGPFDRSKPLWRVRAANQLDQLGEQSEIREVTINTVWE